MPFFSVVIPLFNKESFIEKTLHSVLDQSFTDYEVIIVDDGSTDNSLEMASRINDQRIKILNQKNSGAAAARNYGIEKSSSKYIALLDADDLWLKNHLEEMKKQIDLFPNAGLYCNNYNINYGKNKSRKTNFNFNFGVEPLIVEDYFKASIINPVAWTSAVCFTKENFNKIGGFNSDLEIAEDLDLWNRFALYHMVSFNPKPTMIYNLDVHNSLSKKEHNQIRYDFIKSYELVEKHNPSLKLYLDINRYAVALRCKLNNNIKLYNSLKKEIDFKSLNFKQKVLIHSPNYVIVLIKKLQILLLKLNIYVSAHK